MNDDDRLQQMEDNFNNRDSIYQALGLQQDTMRTIAKTLHKDEYQTALDYYLNEGYPQELAEELATQNITSNENDEV